MHIREARSSDLEKILTLDRISGSDPGRSELVDKALQFHTCLVAEKANGLVGYAVLEYTFYGQGFISMLYVAESDRRRGIGRSLLEALKSRCTTPKLFTSTNESNRQMQALLISLGYTPSGVIHNLDPGDPELVYFQRLGKQASWQPIASDP